MVDPLLTLEDVSVGYDRWPVISGLAIEVPPGSIIAIVGPNAAGKTTILRGLFGYIAWLCGTVRWCGKNVCHLRDKQVPRNAVAWVRQDRPVFAGLTVEEAIRAAVVGDAFCGLTARLGDLVGRSRAPLRQRLSAVSEWLPELESRGLLRKRMSALSSGERAIVSLGVGMVNLPLLLCLDEPAANLDTTMVARLKDVLGRYVAQRGAACLMIEHRTTFLDGFAHRIVSVSGPTV